MPLNDHPEARPVYRAAGPRFSTLDPDPPPVERRRSVGSGRSKLGRIVESVVTNDDSLFRAYHLDPMFRNAVDELLYVRDLRYRRSFEMILRALAGAGRDLGEARQALIDHAHDPVDDVALDVDDSHLDPVEAPELSITRPHHWDDTCDDDECPQCGSTDETVEEDDEPAPEPAPERGVEGLASSARYAASMTLRLQPLDPARNPPVF